MQIVALNDLQKPILEAIAVTVKNPKTVSKLQSAVKMNAVWCKTLKIPFT
jgi:hypothetical protein